MANGGSNAVVGHVAIDLLKVHQISAFAANDPILITCFANDYGHDEWMSEFVRQRGTSDDLFIIVSSSGESSNVVKAASKCEEMGFELVTFSGFDGRNSLRQFGAVSLWVDSHDYNVVENTHQIWLLAICDYLKYK